MQRTAGTVGAFGSREATMQANRIGTFKARAAIAVANLPRARVLALILIVVVPGGLVVPACYAVYHAIRHSRRSPSARASAIEGQPSTVSPLRGAAQ